MEKEFINYEIALALKELGFDKPCFAYYIKRVGINGNETGTFQLIYKHIGGAESYSNLICRTPTFSQVFRWFREKYGYDVSIKKCTPSEYKFEIEQLFVKGDNYYFIDFSFSSHENAELECLKKLIEIVKRKKL